MLIRIDPGQINDTLKEAVAESLLTNLQNAISGGGDEGRVVLATRPSIKFVSGYLESLATARNLGFSIDETANPIHIMTMGMDLQTAKGTNSTINIKSSFSIYVRILPTTNDLILHKTHLSISNESKRTLNQQTREAMTEYDVNNSDLRERNRTQFYQERRVLKKSIANNFLSNQMGVQILTDVELESLGETISEEQEVEARLLREGESNISNNQEETSTTETTSDTESNEIAFQVYPGMASIIPSHIVNPVRPLQKWLRLDFNEMAELIIDVDSDKNELEQSLANYSNTLNQSIQQRLLAWLEDTNPVTGGKLWAYPRRLKVTARQIQTWDEALSEIRTQYHEQNKPSLFAIPQIQLHWLLEVTDSHDNPTISCLRIALENRTDTLDWNSVEVDESIYQSKIYTSLSIAHYRPIKLDRIKPSYQYLQYLNCPALGFNNGVKSSIDDTTISLETTWVPTYRQPRIRPQEYEGSIDVRFNSLCTPSGIRALHSLPNQFDNWISEVIRDIDPTEATESQTQASEEQCRFDRDCESWQKEVGKIRQGIELLCSSADNFERNPNSREAIPFKAWCYMNESMGLAARAKNFERWRLFQVAFILANISGLASRMEEFSSFYDKEWDESVALLYFATGGGKTESFFGLLVFNLFLDRLRGKQNGVTAMIRYPLRLLTIQQAQRLSKTLAKAEEVRWRYEVPGKPFAIGFWVGGSNTPNKRNKVSQTEVPTFRNANDPDETRLQTSSDYIKAMESWNKLPFCPFCGGKTVLRRYTHRNGLIGHACTASLAECSWNQHHAGVMTEPLPFYIVDEDIYETAPSVVLGTIDKLALLGQHPSTIRRFFRMFGLSPSRNNSNDHLIPFNTPQDLQNCPGEKLYPIYKNGVRYIIDPFPSLIIQDEAHLLEESLGTFSGIFETTFERILHILGSHIRMQAIVAKTPEDNNPRMPKIVAASATVTEPERQMEDLYQRTVTQFPYPGPRLYYSFYASPHQSSSVYRQSLEDIEVSAHTARFYASVLTNGRPHTSVAVETLGNFHLLISELLINLNSQDSSNKNKARAKLLNGVNGSILSSLYAPEISIASEEELATLIDLHRISLTYVTNKKGGDQIMAAENDTTGRIHEDAGIENFEGLRAELVSGGVSASEIEEVIKAAERRPNPGDPFDDILQENLLRSVVATSAISHGVDVDEFNTMFFAGMPSDPSEYIQSSSRVGRTHVGISILLPTPQRRRDRYILETHDQYHRFLERMIRPAAVNRWAENAMIRTLPSLIQAYLVGLCENLELLTADDSSKHSVRNYERLEQIVQVINERSNITFIDNICVFVFEAIGLNHPIYFPSAANEFRLILREEVRNFVNSLVENHDLIGLTALFKELDRVETKQKKEPMTSLRDVDPAGKINYVKRGGASVNSETACEIMRIIRQGRS
ncbi:MAG: DEAD/DEAH box helicase [Thiomicrorhabdus sp.]|jgi:hypothetical protein|nr:DEAD/DEAH box helicase [Thiomicrorhabdus sp.]